MLTEQRRDQHQPRSRTETPVPFAQSRKDRVRRVAPSALVQHKEGAATAATTAAAWCSRNVSQRGSRVDFARPPDVSGPNVLQRIENGRHFSGGNTVDPRGALEVPSQVL